jgi:WD40 repeat protein
MFEDFQKSLIMHSLSQQQARNNRNTSSGMQIEREDELVSETAIFEKIVGGSFNLVSTDYSFGHVITNSMLREFPGRPALLAVTTASTNTLVYGLSAKSPYLQSNMILRLCSQGNSWLTNDVDIHRDFWDLSDDSGRILTACSDGNLRLWLCDFSSKNHKDKSGVPSSNTALTYKVHSSKINRARFLWPIEAAISVSETGEIALTDLLEEKQIAMYKQHMSSLTALGLHPSSALVAVGESTGYVAIWDLRVGKYICDFNTDFKHLESKYYDKDMTFDEKKITSRHRSKVTNINFNTSGTLLASSSEDCSVSIWDLRKQQLVKTLAGHKERVVNAQFHPKSDRFVISASADGELRIWDWFSQIVVKQLNAGKNKLATFSVDSEWKMVALGHADKSLNIMSN